MAPDEAPSVPQNGPYFLVQVVVVVVVDLVRFPYSQRQKGVLVRQTHAFSLPSTPASGHPWVDSYLLASADELAVTFYSV